MSMLVNMPRNVEYIIDTLIKSGSEAFIVGGCVRDIILNKEPKDWDITTKARPEEVIRLFDKVILTGLKHGTVTVVLDRENYEVTTYRTDGEYEDNRHPKEVEFVDSLKEDLARRDFTINAMAYNYKVGLIDYFEGAKDLKNKIIKTVGEPEKRFNEDSLRMLRAVRFSAQLDFNISENVLCSIKKLKNNIKNISRERIRDEFNKILLYNPRKIDILRECELLEFIIPEFKGTYNFNQNNPYHIHDLYSHTLLSIESIEPSLYLRLTMALHDLGKVISKSIDKKGISHYYGHGKESVRLSKEILKSLKYDNNSIEKILTLIQYHDCTLKSKLSVKRMLNKIGEELLRDLIKVQRADILAQNPDYRWERLENLAEVEEKLNLIIAQKECFNLKDLKINGGDLISLGFVKGKEIGETLQKLLEIVIEYPELNNQQDLFEIAKKIKDE
ncbi:HD domain-containing protein [Clostridium chromiireducens]|uniref:HD domain-containing protein n=1 Tax=Clostridium chromiireducens TaxID=225345 RepID=A0A964RRB5_9CLOT|nr:HD domain-containing protein [Clostridium chromiireducens]MVX66288.1 HD domain-containing protein [Clostridium chromiireducens]